MKPPTEGPKGGAGDSGAAPSGIVPPYLQGDWQIMRAHLRLAAAHATAAAEASTLEDVRLNGGTAHAALYDADFIRRRIARKERHDDD